MKVPRMNHVDMLTSVRGMKPKALSETSITCSGSMGLKNEGQPGKTDNPGDQDVRRIKMPDSPGDQDDKQPVIKMSDNPSHQDDRQPVIKMTDNPDDQDDKQIKMTDRSR